MDIPNKVDVVVVGGGPSGTIAAYVIAHQGYSVVLLDKKQRYMIGNKTCGEALDIKAPALLLEKYGIELPTKDEVSSQVETISFSASTLANRLSASAPGYIVNRLNYAQRLLSLCESVGVQIVDQTKVRNVITKGDQIAGITYNRLGDEGKIEAKITIDASGYVASVRQAIQGEMKRGITYSNNPKYTVASYREIIEFDEPHKFQKEILLWYLDKIPAPGYAWIFTSGEYRLNIGLTWHKLVPYPNGETLKSIYHDIFDELFPPNSYKIIHSGGGQIPIRPPFDSLVFNGVMLVGDAGAIVDPTTQEGHQPALLSGYEAGITALEALEKNSFRIADLWMYNKRIMKYPGTVHAMSFMLSKFIIDIQAKGLAIFLKRGLIIEKELIEIFQTKDYVMGFWTKFKKALKMFPHINLLLKLKRTLDIIETASEVYESYPETLEGLNAWRKYRNETLDVDL